MSKFLKKLAKKEILIPHLDAYIAKGDFPHYQFDINPHKERDTYFHPSGDCTPCERTLFAKFSGDLAGKGLVASSHKNFMVGHFWHFWLQNILTEGLGFAEERDIERKLLWKSPEGWTVTGAADVAYCDVPGYEKPFLVDFKTMNARQFAETSIPDYVLKKWTAQVNVYMDLLHQIDVVRSDVMYQPEQCIMIVIQKDTPHAFKEVVIDYDPDLVQEIYWKWDRVWDALENDFPPVCDCAPGKCPVETLYVPGA